MSMSWTALKLDFKLYNNMIKRPQIKAKHKRLQNLSYLRKLITYNDESRTHR